MIRVRNGKETIGLFSELIDAQNYCLELYEKTTKPLDLEIEIFICRSLESHR